MTLQVVSTLVVGLAGATCVVLTVLSAAQTLVVPRGTPMLITRVVFIGMGGVFAVLSRRKDYQHRDRVMALYAPLTLLVLPAVWLVFVLTGYTALDWALGVQPWRAAFLASGSSLLTLGFQAPHDVPTALLVFSEAALGLGLLALLISYLPTIYASYSRRETMVAAVNTLAGSPPSGVELLERMARIDGLDVLTGYWHEWTHWFADIEETHTSAPGLVHFRSPRSDRSWVTAAGAVLDAAALLASTVDMGRQPEAELCLRAGHLSLRHIGDYYGMPADPPTAREPSIAISRDEFDAACQRLAAAGIQLKSDRNQSWRDFAGWRVNYDGLLRRFASLCLAPSAPWSADRPILFRRGRIIVRRPRRADR